MKKNIIIFVYKFRLITFGRLLLNIYYKYVFRMKMARIQGSWSYHNLHNYTTIGNTINDMFFPLDKVIVGKGTYGPLCVHHFGNPDEKLKIGNYCSISIGVKFILGGNHSITTFSTYPFRKFFYNGECEAWTKGPIIVEDDVWIGTDAIILSGVRLAKGTVIAAGSVVTKSTEPYSIVAGNPAKKIKIRFDQAIINALMDINFEIIDEKRILNLLPKLYMPLNEKILTEIKNELLTEVSHQP